MNNTQQLYTTEQQKQWEKEAEELYPYINDDFDHPTWRTDAERASYIKGCQIQAARTLPAETNTLESWEDKKKKMEAIIEKSGKSHWFNVRQLGVIFCAMEEYASQYRSQQQVDPPTSNE